MKKKIVFTILIILAMSLILFVGIKFYSINKEKKVELSSIQEIKKNKDRKENKTDVEEIKEEKVSETNQKEQENLNEEKKVEKEIKVDNNISKKDTTTSSSSTTASTNTNNNEYTKVVEKPKQYSVVPEQTPSVNVEKNKSTTSYIGVPNPNDFYYSFHKGHIDKGYSTLDGCNSRTAEVSLIDTVDIINTTCFEVLDGQGTVLGIYMYVKCNSGNCDRYKSLVGIDTN